MKQSRLDALSDGIFAIILTLLTFDLKLPQLSGVVTDQALWNSLLTIYPIFLSFILSFALLFTYWRAHTYYVSTYAKSVDARMTSINALFFFFISLVPFTTRLLGEYNTTKLAIILYSINIIAIGISLLWMRNYVFTSGHIYHLYVTQGERQRGIIRILVPVFCAVIAIILSFYNTNLSFFLLAIAIVFNLLSRSSKLVNWSIEVLKGKWV